jgi:hypothetical protein
MAFCISRNLRQRNAKSDLYESWGNICASVVLRFYTVWAGNGLFISATAIVSSSVNKRHSGS